MPWPPSHQPCHPHAHARSPAVLCRSSDARNATLAQQHRRAPPQSGSSAMDVLDICLHHEVLHAPHIICKLLASARAAAALVACCCRGRLDVAWAANAAPPPGTWAWMAKHMALLRTVKLGDVMRWESLEELRAALQQATTTAAALGQELPLQSWESHTLHIDAVALLPSCLTSLEVEFTFYGAWVGGGGEIRVLGFDAVDAQLAAAINRSRLQQLRRLHVPCASHLHGNPLVSALASLSRLTSLALYQLSRWQCQHMPPSLAELELHFDMEHREDERPLEWTLALRHLTALTRLALPGDLVATDELPESLRELAVHCWRPTSIEHLLQLQHVTRLDLQWHSVPGSAQLRRLTALGRLQHLGVNGSPDLLSLRLLPLKELSSNSYDVSAAALRDIGACTGLTRLSLRHCIVKADVAQLPTILAKLTALEELELHSVFMGRDDDMATDNAAGAAGGASVVGSGDEAAGAAAAAPAAHILPRLRVFHASQLEVAQELAPVLDGRQLTALVVRWSDRLTDAGVAAVCSHLTGLRELELSLDMATDGDMACEGLSDAGLAAIAAALPRLTRLELSDAGDVTAAGVEQLAALRELRELSVPDVRAWGEGTEYVQAAARRKALGIAW